MLIVKCTLLTKKQVCDNPLQMFKKYGTNAAVTDFSLLLGIEVSSDHTSDTLYYQDKSFIETRAADYWTKTQKEDKAIAISSYGFGYNSPKKMNDSYIGIRPVINYSDINKYVKEKRITDKNVLEVDYGEYPQTICDKKLELQLEQMYKENAIQKTEKKYTISSSRFFIPQELDEYYFNGNKYIRFIADRDIIRTKLSNKKYIEFGKTYWIKVEPITWMIDEKEDIAVTKNLLISGIPFDNYNNHKFEDTEIYNYLNNYFIKEIHNIKENKLDDIEKKLETLSLEELKELKIIIERQIKKEVKTKCKGGII